MDAAQFWQLIDSTRDLPDRAVVLANLLEPLDADEIVRFRLLFDDLLQTANTVDLRGAAYTINGGCEDEGFVLFREALIERGRAIFDTAVRDPDSLADVATPTEPMEGTEGLGNAPAMAWAAKTGSTEDAFFEAVDAADVRTDRGAPEEGVWWAFHKKEEVRDRLPRLAAKFLGE
ncbi:MAG TPA: DUF4240 domain-containing protein [Gemmataceae bacterium]|jgi:hypothetical protein|nr:DUF4240 domain-containing protein [Gemmataceae bacterium]